MRLIESQTAMRPTAAVGDGRSDRSHRCDSPRTDVDRRQHRLIEARLHQVTFERPTFSHAPRDDWPAGHDYADWIRENGGDLDALRNSEDRVPPELHQTTWATERSIEFITQERNQPWLLAVNVYDPHPPFIPPAAYAARFDPQSLPGPYFRESDLAQQEKLKQIDFQTQAQRPDEFDGRRLQALYYAMIAQIDDQLARILDCLQQTGQREHTVVVFTSDHGEMAGDHGLLYKGCRFYEGLVRVPLIFSWPGHMQTNLKSDALVELIDKSATLLELAGVSPPQHIQGRSLLPILRGERPPDFHRDFVRCEYYDALGVHFTPGDGDHSFATMYRDRRYKLIVYHGHGLGELYDLEEDPWEFNNLWDVPECRPLKCDLMQASFDQTMLTSVDVGSRRIAPM